MSDIRATSVVRGSIFSVEALGALPSDDCNALLVSSRTLHLLNEFALNEVNFTARYASSFAPGGNYYPVDEDDVAEMNLIQDVARNFRLEMYDMTCDITQSLDGIKAAILTAGSNACACGSVGDTIETSEGEMGGTPPEGFGEPDPTVTDRLCKAANAIHESILDTVTQLEASPAEEYLSLGFGVVTGLVSAIIAAAFIPVVGILLVGVAGAVIGISLALVVVGVDLASLKAELIASTQDLVCALFENHDVSSARNAYLQVLTDAGQSALNTTLLGAMLTNNVLDLLWFSTPDSEAFLDTYVAPTSCAGCSQPSGPGCYYDTASSSPFGVIVFGARDDPPFWLGEGDVFTDPDGWCTNTIRGAGTYQDARWYVKNPVFGHPEWGNGANDVYWSTTLISFTGQNTAFASTFEDLGLGGRNTVVRGPGFSSNAYRPNTSGSPELVTWQQENLGLDPLQEWITLVLTFFYDTNYNNAQDGCLRDIHICSEDLPTPWP